MIWENNTFEEKKKYCNNNINQKLTEDFWSELLALFGNSLYTKGEKKIILDQWAKILDTKGTKGWDYNELMNDARRLTVRLYKITNESNNMDALMGCLTCFVIKNSFTVEQLNDFLIKNGFQYYYTEEGEWKLIQNSIDKKKNLVFISHSFEDKEYVYRFVEFLEDIGMKSDQIFCSSIPEYAVPLDEDIYDFIKSRFWEYDLRVIYMLSKNYYKSVACLNEMGATWILQKKYTSILLPGFVFEQIKGAVNAGKVGIKLDGMENDIKYRLKQLRDNLQLEFELEDISDRQWYRYVDTFIEKIKDIKGSNT